MSAVPKSPIPLDLDRAAELSGVEYVGGRLTEKPVSIESGEIELSIGALLRAEAVKTGAARVFPASVGYRCFADDPSKFRKPDVSVVRADRVVGQDFDACHFSIPADLERVATQRTMHPQCSK